MSTERPENWEGITEEHIKQADYYQRDNGALRTLFEAGASAILPWAIAEGKKEEHDAHMKAVPIEDAIIKHLEAKAHAGGVVEGRRLEREDLRAKGVLLTGTKAICAQIDYLPRIKPDEYTEKVWVVIICEEIEKHDPA